MPEKTFSESEQKLLDQFATAALPVFAKYYLDKFHGEGGAGEYPWRDAAQDSYDLAEAMLEERRRQ